MIPALGGPCQPAHRQQQGEESQGPRTLESPLTHLLNTGPS